MKIGGINTLTLLDFPGKVSAIVFTAGCNFRCGYCHNVQFVEPSEIEKISGHFIPEEKFFNFLKTRKGLLDGVVVSGGEPTIWPDLPNFLRKIKNQGFLTKLDTNGTNPKMLEKIFKEKLVDYVAMDIKMPLNEYETLAGVKTDGETLRKSVEIIKNSAIEYEFRTTVIEEFHDVEVMKRIFEDIGHVQKFTLQNFRPEKTLCPSFGKFHACTTEKMALLQEVAQKYTQNLVAPQ
jgi:pyruvate formate lyase activating enzyme